MSVPPPRPTRYVLSNSVAAALRDIAHHIELASQFVAGFVYETYNSGDTIHNFVGLVSDLDVDRRVVVLCLLPSV